MGGCEYLVTACISTASTLGASTLELSSGKEVASISIHVEQTSVKANLCRDSRPLAAVSCGSDDRARPHKPDLLPFRLPTIPIRDHCASG